MGTRIEANEKIFMKYEFVEIKQKSKKKCDDFIQSFFDLFYFTFAFPSRHEDTIVLKHY